VPLRDSLPGASSNYETRTPYRPASLRPFSTTSNDHRSPTLTCFPCLSATLFIQALGRPPPSMPQQRYERVSPPRPPLRVWSYEARCTLEDSRLTVPRYRNTTRTMPHPQLRKRRTRYPAVRPPPFTVVLRRQPLSLGVSSLRTRSSMTKTVRSQTPLTRPRIRTIATTRMAAWMTGSG
jgi:hypothetical protein